MSKDEVSEKEIKTVAFSEVQILTIQEDTVTKGKSEYSLANINIEDDDDPTDVEPNEVKVDERDHKRKVSPCDIFQVIISISIAACLVIGFIICVLMKGMEESAPQTTESQVTATANNRSKTRTIQITTTSSTVKAVLQSLTNSLAGVSSSSSNTSRSYTKN